MNSIFVLSCNTTPSVRHWTGLYREFLKRSLSLFSAIYVLPQNISTPNSEAVRRQETAARRGRIAIAIDQDTDLPDFRRVATEIRKPPTS